MTRHPTQPDATEAKPNKGGAPPGNRNAIRHGMRGSALPDGCNHVARDCYQFRRNLEDEVLQARGELTLTDCAFISTAFRCERHAALAQHWLATEGATLSISDRLACSREAARASEARDKAIANLRLPQRHDADAWAGLTLANGNADSPAEPTPTTDAHDAPEPADATTGALSDDD